MSDLNGEDYLAPIMLVEEVDGEVRNVITSSYYDKSTEETERFTSSTELIEKINSTVCRVSFFCSKRCDIDEFTNKNYDYEEDIPFDELTKRTKGYLTCKKIIGSSSFVSFHYGLIGYHSSNELLFNFATIDFMLSNSSFPIMFTDINMDNVYDFKRSNGDTNKGMVKENTSLRKSTTLNCHVINIKFDPDITIEDDIESFSKSYSYMEKSIPLRQFIELNNIPTLKFEIPDFYQQYMKDMEDGKIICPCAIDSKLLILANEYYISKSIQYLSDMKLELENDNFKIISMDNLSMVVSI
jgi:hypothetical protein